MYKIKGIYHSGRKDERFKPVDDEKYDGLVGCRIKWDINDLEQFESTRFKIVGHPFYSWWHTSPVIQLTKRDENTYILETVNTLYELEEI